MRTIYWAKRMIDHWQTRRIASDLMERGRWSPEKLRQHQQQALENLVAYARQHSPFYRDLYAGVSWPICLADLPILTKEIVMEHFDALVTDRRVGLTSLQHHLSTLNRDEYWLGRYRALASSGTTGRLGYFLFNRREWNTVLANRLRTGSLGPQASQVDAAKTALILSRRPSSVSLRSAWTIGLRGDRSRIFDCSLEIESLVHQLNRLQPERLVGYASTIALLAQKQLSKQLAIAPVDVLTGAEMLTASMIKDIHNAWSVWPRQTYGMTESPSIGFPCPVHPFEIHLCEDLAVIENVDSDNRVVGDGVTGDKVLLTNLYNKSQPLIRYEITDRIQLQSGPCECGSPFRRIRQLHGRTDDCLILPGLSGGSVTLEPLLLEGAIKTVSAVIQYQVRFAEGALTLHVVTSASAGDQQGIAERLRRSLHTLFANRQAQSPEVEILFVRALEREPGGKLKWIQR